MAKGGNVGASSWKTINQTARAFQRNRMGDYRVALSASAAGSANQAAQLGRAEAFLQSGMQASTRALTGLSKAAKANQRSQRAEQGRLSSQYGSGLSGIASTYLKPANAQARATSLDMAAAGAVGKAGGKTASMMETMGAQEVAAQGNAAKYALAQALQQRTILDNQTLAGLESQVMQFEQQKAMLKYQYDMQAKAAKKADALKFPGLQVVVNSMTDNAAGVMKFFNDPANADIRGDASQLAQAYIAKNNITDPAEAQMVNALVSTMFKGTTFNADGTVSGALVGGAGNGGVVSADIQSAITQTMGQLYPDFNPTMPTTQSFLAAAAALREGTTPTPPPNSGDYSSMTPDQIIAAGGAYGPYGRQAISSPANPIIP